MENKENGLFKFNQLLTRMDKGDVLTNEEMLFISAFSSRKTSKICNIFLWVYIIIPVAVGILSLMLLVA